MRKCGFFHGECPIHETGRQSYAKRLIQLRKKRWCSAIRMCPFVQFDSFFYDPETENGFRYYL